MKNYNNSEEFKAYKKGLKARIDHLERELDFSPQRIINAINPFRGTNSESSQGNNMLKTAIKLVPKFLITKALGKSLNPLTSALIPLAATGAGKVLDEIEQQGILEKMLDRVISATELSNEDKMILEAAEIEDQINEVEESIYDNSKKAIDL